MLYWYLELSILPVYDVQPSITIDTESISSKPLIETHIHAKLTSEAEEYGYSNINGPSLIKVPDWIDGRLGNYYLYFAHHKGKFIRMAYADNLTGPYTLYEPDIMHVDDSTMSVREEPSSSWSDLRKYTSWSEARAIMQVGRDAKEAYEERIQAKLSSKPSTTPHIASPEIVIDEKSKSIKMYFHGVVEGNIQMTKVAQSKDGLDFQPNEEILGLPYMRTFTHRGKFYGISNFTPRRKWLYDTKVRHCGLYKSKDVLYIFYSRVGDQPERILCSVMDISSDWNNWKASKPIEVIQPTSTWEGALEPLIPSVRGEAEVMVHQLRDPYIYTEGYSTYLLYTGGGEQNIGIKKININKSL